MGYDKQTVYKNYAKPSSEAAFVLRDHTPVDVVKAIIQGDKQKEPFFIFDMDVAYRYIQLFREKLPRDQIFYAMKSNDSAMTLKLAVAMGLGFDCASPGEIYKIRQLNVSPTSMIFAMPTKTPEQMQYARQTGVRHTTFDGSSELKKLKQYWPDARLLIRIRVASNCVYQLGDKFGCDFETEAKDLLDEAANLGLHVSDIVNTALEELFPDTNVQVIAEPGRFLSEPAFTLYCNIKDVRETIIDNKHLNALYINDGVNGSLFALEKWHHIHLYEKPSVTDEESEDTVLYGPTTDDRDLIVDVKLPKCSAQNWLVIKSQGSYSIVFATRCNCIKGIKIRILISLKLW